MAPKVAASEKAPLFAYIRSGDSGRRDDPHAFETIDYDVASLPAGTPRPLRKRFSWLDTLFADKASGKRIDENDRRKSGIELNEHILRHFAFAYRLDRGPIRRAWNSPAKTAVLSFELVPASALKALEIGDRSVVVQLVEFIALAVQAIEVK